MTKFFEGICTFYQKHEGLCVLGIFVIAISAIFTVFSYLLEGY